MADIWRNRYEFNTDRYKFNNDVLKMHKNQYVK